MTYPYRVYGLTLGCDTPVSALPLEPSDFERYDVIVSLGPEADWVRGSGLGSKSQVPPVPPRAPEARGSRTRHLSFHPYFLRSERVLRAFLWE